MSELLAYFYVHQDSYFGLLLFVLVVSGQILSLANIKRSTGLYRRLKEAIRKVMGEKIIGDLLETYFSPQRGNI